MTDWPNVDVVIITYDRFHEILKTIEALEDYLTYPREHLRYLIADDATPGNYRQKLSITQTFRKLDNYQFVPDQTQNLGWGGNANRALRYSDAPYVFFLEDDRVLVHDLDLQAGIACMQVKPEIGMIRYGGTSGTHMIYHQMEADISPYLPQYREGMGLFGKMTYFLLDSGAPDLWIYSNTPHLKRRNFHDPMFYGPYPEGQKLGATEEQMAHLVIDKMRSNPFAPVIATLPDWVQPHFDHIGQSYQHSELDKERLRVDH